MKIHRLGPHFKDSSNLIFIRQNSQSQDDFKEFLGV